MRKAILAATVTGLCCTLAFGQTHYKVLWSFGANNGVADGVYPNEGLITDSAGNMYGTTSWGGAVGGSGYGACYSGCGTVFELSPRGDGSWTETVLYDFCTSTLNSQTCPEGAFPDSGLVFDKAGNLYGTDVAPGGGNVFVLSPPRTPGGGWTQTVLWTSPGLNGQLTFDDSGNLYGTTDLGGAYGWGSAFELSPSFGGGWAPTTLYSFCQGGNPLDCPDGFGAYAGVVFDSSGNLYGMAGGSGNPYAGLVFELTPNQTGEWTETVLYEFSGDGLAFYDVPGAGVTLDPAGNVYGSAPIGGVKNAQYCKINGGPDSCGGVFRLEKKTGWHFQAFDFIGRDGGVPGTSITLDGQEQVAIGATELGGAHAHGTIYKIEGRKESVLHSFCSLDHCADGSEPGGGGGLLLKGGNVYGTTWKGGTYDQGVVFEFVP
jgi:hypothetical protein